MTAPAKILPVALDAMGGDHAPHEPISGAVTAARDHGVAVCLVGDEARIREELAKLGGTPPGITVVHASETIEMHEHPARALRAKPNASLPVAVGMVKDRSASAAVSAGNSGAIMAAGIFVLKRQPGIDRPAFGGVIPTRTGQAFLIDMGANADCKPAYLVQFARMGAVYVRVAQGLESPRVGLISNGEEEGKGSALTLAAYDLLKDSGLNFIGNIEGNDVTDGVADVIVCDGFTGNVILKTMEGTASTIISLLRESLKSNVRSKLGAALAMPALRALGARLDYAEYGGVPVLGVEGVLINCHGRSKARAITQALRLADRMARQDLVGAIGRELAAAALTVDAVEG
ncbi:MAG: PlsX [Chloroflexi bacterium]|jgi:glycerol-3-phosphate acyltransferase PlsX|nr:PlsX [Chloroflexota bacterium]